MDFVTITALAALAVVAVQQILKLNVIPVFFANKYPLITNIGLSIVASVIVTWQTAIQLTTVAAWVSYVFTVSIIAAITYNNTLRKSEAVQEASNKKES